MVPQVGNPRQLSARERRLAMVLRRLRKQAGLTSAEVANQLGVSTSMVSRGETGKRGIQRDDLIGLLTVYRAPRRLRDAIVKLYDDMRKPDLLDRGELNIHEVLATWIDFEQDASWISNYEPLLIPGLLQTFAYAKAVIEGTGVPLSEQEIDDLVAARIARQKLLRGPDRPHLEVVLHEAALHQRVGGVEVMREQLNYLMEAAQRPSVTIRVIQAIAGAHPGMGGPFVIMDYQELPSLVHLENKVASLYLEEPADVQAYKLAFKGLLAVALSPEQSVQLIRRIAAGMA
jgi:transcriptional regulator with XRE-family HTH domain